MKQSSELAVCTWTALLSTPSKHTMVAMVSIFTTMSMVVAECQIFLARPIPAHLMVMGVTREGASNLIFKLFPTRRPQLVTKIHQNKKLGLTALTRSISNHCKQVYQITSKGKDLCKDRFVLRPSILSSWRKLALAGGLVVKVVLVGGCWVVGGLVMGLLATPHPGHQSLYRTIATPPPPTTSSS